MKEKICLYGFGVVGMACFSKYYREKWGGRDIVCIIDMRANVLFENGQYCGVPVYESIEEAIGKVEFDKVLITATTPASVRDIRHRLNGLGIFEIEQFSTKEVYIDVSGKCNLRCKSCQVSNRNTKYVDYDKRTMMLPELFEKIIIKLKSEIDDLKYVYLYIFGDPLLNPWITDIINILHEYDLLGIISTNLSMNIDFDKLLEASPDCIKISLSGFSQDVYGSTHNGGNIELVKENLKRISEYNMHHEFKIPVIVGYHSYTNNQGVEKEQMQAFCKEYGMFFQEVEALYHNRVKQWGMVEYTPDDITFIEKLYERPEEKMKPPIIHNEKACEYINRGVFVDYKGDIILCCSIFADDATYGAYLDTALEEANKVRQNSNWCGVCKKYGMQA